MSEERNAVRFRQAAALLPPHLRRPVERLDGTSQARVEELRLRAGRPLTLVCPEGERTVPGAEAPVRSMDLSLVLEIATQASAHTALEMAANCGVSLLCTAHAGSLEELKARPLYRRLLDEGLFRRLAIIERAGRERRYQVVELC